MWRYLASLLCALSLCVLTAGPLAAEDKPLVASPQEAARAAYSRGVEAFSAENYQLAHEQFTVAEETFPSPNIELMLGRTLAKLGRWVEAQAVLHKARAGSNAPKYANTAHLAGSELALVEKQLAHVELEVASTQGDEQLSINGVEIERGAWSAPIAVDPGPVKIVLSRAGASPSVKTLELVPGAHEHVKLELAVPVVRAEEYATRDQHATAEATAPMTRSTEPPSTEDRSGHPTLRTLSYVLAGVGAVGVAGFAVLGAYSHGHYNKLEELCPGDGPCDPGYQWVADKGSTYQTLANVSLIAGGVVLAAGVTLWIVSLSPGRAEVAVTTNGVQVKGSF
jgi:hypothetical protein